MNGEAILTHVKFMFLGLVTVHVSFLPDDVFIVLDCIYRIVTLVISYSV